MIISKPAKLENIEQRFKLQKQRQEYKALRETCQIIGVWVFFSLLQFFFILNPFGRFLDSQKITIGTFNLNALLLSKFYCDRMIMIMVKTMEGVNLSTKLRVKNCIWNLLRNPLKVLVGIVKDSMDPSPTVLSNHFLKTNIIKMDPHTNSIIFVSLLFYIADVAD
jgi:hypothetical protein